MSLILQGATDQVTAGQNLIQNAAIPTMGQGQGYLQEAGRLAQQLREIPYQYQTAAGEGLLASTGTFDPSAQRMGPMDPQVQQQMQQLSMPKGLRVRPQFSRIIGFASAISAA